MHPPEEKHRDKEEPGALPYIPHAENYVKVNKSKYNRSGNYHHKQARENQITSNAYVSYNNYSYMGNNTSGNYNPGKIHHHQTANGRYHKMGYNEGSGHYLPRGRTYRSNNGGVSNSVGTGICEEEIIVHQQYNKRNGGNRYHDSVAPSANGFKTVPDDPLGRSPNGVPESNGAAEKESDVEGMHKNIYPNGKGQNWIRKTNNRMGRGYPARGQATLSESGPQNGPRSGPQIGHQNGQQSAHQSDEQSGTPNEAEVKMKSEIDSQQENHHIMEMNNDKENPNGFSTKGRRKNNGKYMNAYKSGANYVPSSVSNRSSNYFGGGISNHGQSRGYGQINGYGYKQNYHQVYNQNYSQGYNQGYNQNYNHTNDNKYNNYNNNHNHNGYNNNGYNHSGYHHNSYHHNYSRYSSYNQGGSQSTDREARAAAKLSTGGEDPLGECAQVCVVQKESPPDGGVSKSDNCVGVNSPSNQLGATAKTDVAQGDNHIKGGSCNERNGTYAKPSDVEVGTEECLKVEKDANKQSNNCDRNKNIYDGSCNSEENPHGNHQVSRGGHLCGNDTVSNLGDVVKHVKHDKCDVVEVLRKDHCSSKESLHSDGRNNVMGGSPYVQANNGVTATSPKGNYSPISFSKNGASRKKALNRSSPPVYSSNYEINIHGSFWRGKNIVSNGNIGGARSDDPNGRDPLPGTPPATHKGYKRSERVEESTKSLVHNDLVTTTQRDYIPNVTQLERGHSFDEDSTVTKEYDVSGNGELQVGNPCGRTLREDEAWEASPGGELHQEEFHMDGVCRDGKTTIGEQDTSKRNLPMATVPNGVGEEAHVSGEARQSFDHAETSHGGDRAGNHFPRRLLSRIANYEGGRTDTVAGGYLSGGGDYNEVNGSCNQVSGNHTQCGGDYYSSACSQKVGSQNAGSCNVTNGSHNPGAAPPSHEAQEPPEMHRSGAYKKQNNVFPPNALKRHGRNSKAGKSQFPSMHECFFSTNKRKGGSTQRSEPVEEVDEAGRQFILGESVYGMKNEGTVFVGDCSYTDGSPFCAKGKILSREGAVESSTYDAGEVHSGDGKPKYNRKEEISSTTDSTTMNCYRVELKTLKEEVQIGDSSWTPDKGSLLVKPNLTQVRDNEHLKLIMPVNAWKKEPILRKQKKGTNAEKFKRPIMSRDAGVTRKERGGIGGLVKEDHTMDHSDNDHDKQHDEQHEQKHAVQQRFDRANAPTAPPKHRRSRSENIHCYQNNEFKNLEVAMMKPHMDTFKRTVNVKGVRTILEKVLISYIDGDVVERGVSRTLGAPSARMKEHQKGKVQCTLAEAASVCSYVERGKWISSVNRTECFSEKETTVRQIGAVKTDTSEKDKAIYFLGEHLNYGSNVKTQNTFLCLPIERALLLEGDPNTDDDEADNEEDGNDAAEGDADPEQWEDKRINCRPGEEQGSPLEGMVRGEFLSRRDCVGAADACGGSSRGSVNCDRGSNYGERGHFGGRGHHGGRGHYRGGGNYRGRGNYGRGGHYGRRGNYHRGDVHNKVVSRDNMLKFFPQETTPPQRNLTNGNTTGGYSKNEVMQDRRYGERGVIQNDFMLSGVSATGTGTTTTATIESMATMDRNASNYAQSKVQVNSSTGRMASHQIGHKGFFAELPERRRRNVNTSDYCYMSGQNDSSTENYPQGCSVGSTDQSGVQNNSYTANQGSSELAGEAQNYSFYANRFEGGEHPKGEDPIGGGAPVDSMKGMRSVNGVNRAEGKSMRDFNGGAFNEGYGRHNQSHMNDFTQRRQQRNGTANHYGVGGQQWSNQTTNNTGNNRNHFNSYVNRNGTMRDSRFPSQSNVPTGNIFPYADGGSMPPHHGGSATFSSGIAETGSGFYPNEGVLNPGNNGESVDGGYHYNGGCDTTFKSAAPVSGCRKGRNAPYVGGYAANCAVNYETNWSAVAGPSTSPHFAAPPMSVHKRIQGKRNHVNADGFNNVPTFDELKCEDSEVAINDASENTSPCGMAGKRWAKNYARHTGMHYGNDRRQRSNGGVMQSRKTQPSQHEENEKREEHEHTMYSGRQDVIQRDDIDSVGEADHGSHPDGPRSKSQNRWMRGVEEVSYGRDTRSEKGEREGDVGMDVMHGKNDRRGEGEPHSEEEENETGDNGESLFKRKNRLQLPHGDREGILGKAMRKKTDGLRKGDLLVGTPPCDDVLAIDPAKERKCVEMVRGNGTEGMPPSHFEVVLGGENSAFKGEAKQSQRKDNIKSNRLTSSRMGSSHTKVGHANSSPREQVASKMRSPKQGGNKTERKRERACNEYTPYEGYIRGTNDVSNIEPVFCTFEGENADDYNDPTEEVNQFDHTARDYEVCATDQQQLILGDNPHGSADVYTQETSSFLGDGRSEPNENTNKGSYRRKNKNKKSTYEKGANDTGAYNNRGGSRSAKGKKK
ncbi:hypothetical protein C922_04241 [Plasmodium inui San Antonio 1]|uniref:Asparagine-rich antigen n=1 Tax=Plasmodium inui San Antonio 1 TaxID=1237626 RepID=W7A1Q1_9APIC|nr:hypothetical protein C922_04241 [Plasmodium inui San Antonio 1]EUD65298.1 hypothetical protein C922_04241 [Plasmodium inui San Antonio 1]